MISNPITSQSKGKPLSAYILIAANLFPVYGVLFLDWNLFQIIFLYWLESAVIGVYNIFRMIKINPKISLALVPFFTVHFGIFMFVHLVFIVAFANMQNGSLVNNSPSFLLALALLFISHGTSYCLNFLGKKEYLRKTIKQQMFIPYKRVVVMHLTLLFGFFLLLTIGQPIILLLLLIGLKIGIDYFAHLREHLTVANVPVSNSQTIR